MLPAYYLFSSPAVSLRETAHVLFVYFSKPALASVICVSIIGLRFNICYQHHTACDNKVARDPIIYQ